MTYFIKAEHLKYYAALPGCSESSEVSDDTIKFLANELDTHQTKYIIVDKNSNNSIADKIKENTKSKECEILIFDTITNFTIEDIESGYNYLDAYKSNIDTLEKALLYNP